MTSQKFNCISYFETLFVQIWRMLSNIPIVSLYPTNVLHVWASLRSPVVVMQFKNTSTLGQVNIMFNNGRLITMSQPSQ
jgi:hypothetical protein